MVKKPNRQFREKRKTQRLNIPIQVKYKLLSKNRVLNETFSQDISGGGVKLRLSNPLKKGVAIKTLLHFPYDKIPITAYTKVARCNRRLVRGKPRYDIGMQYVRINPKDRERFVFRFCEMMINHFVFGARRK